MAKQSLREILTICISKALENQHLLRSEQEALVDHILNYSILRYSEDNLHLKSAKTLGGINQASRDETIEIPRFLLFSFQSQQVHDILHKIGREWELKSFKNFQKLTENLGLYAHMNENVVILIDGEVIDYAIVRGEEDDQYGAWITDIKFNELKPYQLSYLHEDKLEVEQHVSKKELEKSIIRVFVDGAEDIEATCSVEMGKVMHFRIEKDVYNSRLLGDIEGTEYLEWLKEDDELGFEGALDCYGDEYETW